MHAAIVRQVTRRPPPMPSSRTRRGGRREPHHRHGGRHHAGGEKPGAGTHYSASGAFPFVAGVDGVGRRDDGSRVFFAMRAPRWQHGRADVAPSALCVPLPAGLDDVTAAAIANPGMSSWAAYEQRAKLAPGETVLVNGATGAAGRLAVQIARYGSAQIIATGAIPRRCGRRGARRRRHDPTRRRRAEERFKAQFAEGVDVVMDYLWGTSAEHLMRAAARAGGRGRSATCRSARPAAPTSRCRAPCARRTSR